ncbi:MAG: DUF4912 domain-containing protein [Planctomycetes bacterium]|nr:DUF4912 domain-containing protein [Planctomycetota bacterium]
MSPHELDRLTLAQLRDLAGRHAVADAGTLKKPDLIAALAKATGVSGSGRVPDSAAPGPAGSSRVEEQKPQQTGPRQAEPGLPIPDRYGRDRLVLMVQDPFHVFAYWELSAQALDQARTACGEQGTPVLILHTASGAEQREVDLRGGNYYLSVAPNANYEAQLALRDSKGQLHPLARSNRVTTPAATVSARRDEQWMSVDDSFGELLEMAGLPNANAGQGSAARLSDRTRQQWTWETNAASAPAMFSGILPAEASPGGASSASLSSWNLSSASMVREREATAQRGASEPAKPASTTSPKPAPTGDAANSAPDLGGFPE